MKVDPVYLAESFILIQVFQIPLYAVTIQKRYM
jgi:hypothetical protein